MRIKKNYVLRKIAENWMVLPLAEETINFSGMLTLNDSGVMLWNLLEKGTTKDALVAAMLAEYEVSEEVAAADVDSFLEKLIQAGCVEE